MTFEARDRPDKVVSMRGASLGLLLFMVVACGDSSSASDGRNDATVNGDAAPDAATDSGHDASAQDTGVQDSASDADIDAGDDASYDAGTYDGALPFTCGSLVCTPLQYCTVSKGLVSLDGGVYTGYSCTALPKKCMPTPTCACLTTVGPCSCTASGDDLTVDCYY